MMMRAVLPAMLLPLFARDVPARTAVAPTAHTASDTPMTAETRSERSTAWAESLAPVAVTSFATGATAPVRLYTRAGEVDEVERMRFEHVVARDGEQHVLAERLEQLVVKTAYHFGGAHVVVVSGWREHAGRHTAGEALDFKLEGVAAAQVAAYLRGLPRVGVGIYTHPRTQYVHLDVREPSYHWLDASPPGVTWKERQLGDPGQTKRDAAWCPEDDLPL
jgi:uncharacterized protein YcbK (DUF882 family)